MKISTQVSLPYHIAYQYHDHDLEQSEHNPLPESPGKSCMQYSQCAEPADNHQHSRIQVFSHEQHPYFLRHGKPKPCTDCDLEHRHPAKDLEVSFHLLCANRFILLRILKKDGPSQCPNGYGCDQEMKKPGE